MIYAVAIVHRRLHMSKPGRGLDDASPPSRCYSADGEDTPSHTGGREIKTVFIPEPVHSAKV